MEEEKLDGCTRLKEGIQNHSCGSCFFQRIDIGIGEVGLTSLFCKIRFIWRGASPVISSIFSKNIIHTCFIVHTVVRCHKSYTWLRERWLLFFKSEPAPRGRVVFEPK